MKLRDDLSDVLAFIFGACLLAAFTVGILCGHWVTSAGYEREIAAQGVKLVAAERKADVLKIELEAVEKAFLDNRLTFDAWEGLVSFYAHAHDGRQTASGTRFDMNAHTSASMTLPFGTDVLVLDLERQTWTLTRVTDRGPHPRLGRSLDLSLAGARELGMEKRGVIPAVMITLRPRPSGGD